MSYRRPHHPGCGGLLVREELPVEEVFIPVIRCVNCGWYGFAIDSEPIKGCFQASKQSEREGEAPKALPLEGAT